MNILERLKVRTEESNEKLLNDLLESAATIILARRFPYVNGTEQLEPRYEDLQLRIAVELYARIGAEGQVAHSENGIDRTWAAACVSPELLNEVVPMCGGIS